jgi:hypothetical protein
MSEAERLALGGNSRLTVLERAAVSNCVLSHFGGKVPT